MQDLFQKENRSGAQANHPSVLSDSIQLESTLQYNLHNMCETSSAIPSLLQVPECVHALPVSKCASGVTCVVGDNKLSHNAFHHSQQQQQLWEVRASLPVY